MGSTKNARLQLLFETQQEIMLRTMEDFEELPEESKRKIIALTKGYYETILGCYRDLTEKAAWEKRKKLSLVVS